LAICGPDAELKNSVRLCRSKPALTLSVQAESSSSAGFLFAGRDEVTQRLKGYAAYAGVGRLAPVLPVGAAEACCLRSMLAQLSEDVPGKAPPGRGKLKPTCENKETSATSKMHPLSRCFRGCPYCVIRSLTLAWHNCVQNFLALSKYAISLDWLRGHKIRNAVHKLIELEVLEYYSSKTGEVWFCPIGNFKAFDGISQSKSHSVEVKFEAKAVETYNLCIEFQFSGKPSGLAATNAEKWVHVVPLDRSRMVCFEFDVEALRLRLANFPLWTGGDGKRSKFKLLPLSEAEKTKTAKFEIEIDWTQAQPYWS
jgi:hypothetical protein